MKKKIIVNTEDIECSNLKIRIYAKLNRYERDLTQKEMAKKLGIKYRCYQDFENGKTKIIHKYFYKMMKKLELHIVDKNNNIYL